MFTGSEPDGYVNLLIWLRTFLYLLLTNFKRLSSHVSFEQFFCLLFKGATRFYFCLTYLWTSFSNSKYCPCFTSLYSPYRMNDALYFPYRMNDSWGKHSRFFPLCFIFWDEVDRHGIEVLLSACQSHLLQS